MEGFLLEVGPKSYCLSGKDRAHPCPLHPPEKEMVGGCGDGVWELRAVVGMGRIGLTPVPCTPRKGDGPGFGDSVWGLKPCLLLAVCVKIGNLLVWYGSFGIVDQD